MTTTTRVGPFTSVFTVIISVFVVYFLVWRSPFDAVLDSSFLQIGSSVLPPAVAAEEEDDDSMKFRMKRLVTGENRASFQVSGFTCQANQRAEQCITSNQVRIHHNNTDDRITIYILPNNNASSSFIIETNRTIRPYTLRDDVNAMKFVSPVQILKLNAGNFTDDTAVIPSCQYTHIVPAAVFSSGGFTGNMYHELDELLVPLFITTKHFKSDIQFFITDYRPSVIHNKYRHFITGLSKFEPIIYSSDNVSASSTTHCFPAGAVIGLNYHGNVAVNSSDVPFGYTMTDFRRFMYQSFNLNPNSVTNHTKPTTSNPILVLISRARSRVLLNEKQVVGLMEEVGFQVHIASEYDTSDLDSFPRVLSECDVVVGVHGAGLSNAVFMPVGGVVVQVAGLGLKWPGMYYYADPAISMGLKHVEYLIEPEESSLLEVYGPDAPEIVDPESVFAKGYSAARAVYIDGQNVTLDLNRFRETLIEVRRSFN